MRRLKSKVKVVPSAATLQLPFGYRHMCDVDVILPHWKEYVDAIRSSNANFSAGLLAEGKRDIRVRAIGRFESPQEVLDMIIRRDAAGPVYVRDVAEVVRTYKEKANWSRARGQQMLLRSVVRRLRMEHSPIRLQRLEDVHRQLQQER